MSGPQFADDFLPVYDVSDAVATVVEAGPGDTWQALLDVDLLKLGREAPLLGMLGAVRMLPEIVGHLLHGERPVAASGVDAAARPAFHTDANGVYVVGPLLGMLIAVACAVMLRGRGDDPISHAAGSGVLTPQGA